MTLLEDLAPEVDVDAAFDAFKALRARNGRRRRAARVGAVTVAGVALAALAVGVIRTNDDTVTVSVAVSSTTTEAGIATWPSVQAAIDAYVQENPKVRERGRFEVDANHWLLIAEGEIPIIWERGSNWKVGVVQFDRIDGRWRQGSTDGAGMIDRCFVDGGEGDLDRLTPYPKGASRPTEFLLEYGWALASDPTWSIQVRKDGKWIDLPTTEGVFFERLQSPRRITIPPTSHDELPKKRPITADGHVPSCFAQQFPDLAK